MKPFKKSLTIFLLISACCLPDAFGQFKQSFRSFSKPTCPEQEKRNNEFTYSCEPDGIFYCNSLMLGDMALNYFAFSLESQGELTLVKGDSKTGMSIEIPFYLRLRRNGMLITLPCDTDVIYSKAEISSILKAAQDGDELIVEPVNKEDWPAKRIIKIGDKC